MARLTAGRGPEPANGIPARSRSDAGIARPLDNRSRLFTVAVSGRVAPPRVHPETISVDRDGRAFLLPGTGGVCPDVHAGDLVSRWLADHLMVGASIEDSNSGPEDPGQLHLLACIGNRVRDAAGETLGVVAGKRGGLAPGFMPPNLLSVEAPSRRLQGLAPGATVVLEAIGRGLELTDWPDVMLVNLSPAIADALPLRELSTSLEVRVRASVTSRAAGAGLGQDAWVGDLEITDMSLVEPSGIDLAFGDLVAFDAIESRHGRYYRPGITSIGMVAHGPSRAPGHGIGVTILVTGPTERLGVVLDDASSLAPVLREMAGTEPTLAHRPGARPAVARSRPRRTTHRSRE